MWSIKWLKKFISKSFLIQLFTLFLLSAVSEGDTTESSITGNKASVDGNNIDHESFILKNPPNEPSSIEMLPYIISCLVVELYLVDTNPLSPEVYTAILIVTLQPELTPTPHP